MAIDAPARCPSCGAAMRTHSLRGVTVTECPACRGVWFDDGELAKVTDAADHDLQWLRFELWKHPERFRVEKRPELCPRCAKAMVVIDYDETGVQVHTCAACRGVWLERGALHRIILSLERELDAMTAGDWLGATLREGRELVTGEKGLASEWRDFLSVAHLLRLRVFVEHPGLLELIMNVQRGSPVR
jgi:Zn-finger nucleic acid-binding protein